MIRMKLALNPPHPKIAAYFVVEPSKPPHPNFKAGEEKEYHLESTSDNIQLFYLRWLETALKKNLKFEMDEITKTVLAAKPPYTKAMKLIWKKWVEGYKPKNRPGCQRQS